MSESSTPKQLGFSMPAEWTPHDAVWTAWPHDNENWEGWLKPVRKEFANFVQTLSRFEPVNLLVADAESEATARELISDLSNIKIHLFPHNDVWLRDSGCLFINGPDMQAAVSFGFNGWGNKYPAELDNNISGYIAEQADTSEFELDLIMEGGSLETNGAGVCITTRQCLLSKQRNPHMSEEEIEETLCEVLGFDLVVWLDNGLEGDHTDGHIDTITRFASEKVIVTSVCEDASDVNFKTMNDNLEVLRKLEGFEIVELPLPISPLFLNLETRLPPTYANFYIGNGCVLVPLYGDPNDDRAIEILTPLFPGREVIGLSSYALIHGGGSFHCVTQQQPKLEVAE